MLDRCSNPDNPSYKHYGGRGISVCERWHDPQCFDKDMGERPSGYSIERTDNDGNYTPENCIWADDTTQARNRRFTKLTLEKARDIRALPRRAKNGKGIGYTREEIAGMYHVSVATVKKVLSGEHWKDPSMRKSCSQ